MYSLNQLQEIALKKIESTTSLKVFENIVDKDGHARFIDLEGTPATIEGMTISYCKASLSGSHLLFVCAGSIANGTTISNNDEIVRYQLPKWIYDKIYPVWDTYRVELKSVNLTASNWSTQEFKVVLNKSATEGRILITKVENLTLSADRSFRIAFDLLIDNE